MIDMPVQTPTAQRSPAVQESWSSQGLPSGWPLPMQEPAKQESCVVQRSKSSQALPLGRFTYSHPAGSQVSAVHGFWSSQIDVSSMKMQAPSVWRQRSRVHMLWSSQSLVSPRQTPCEQTALMTHLSAGEQAMPSAKLWVQSLAAGSNES